MKKIPSMFLIGSDKYILSNDGHVTYAYTTSEKNVSVNIWFEINSEDVNIITNGNFWATLDYWEKLINQINKIKNIINKDIVKDNL